MVPAAVVGGKALDVLAQFVLCIHLDALEGSEDIGLAGESFNPEHARHLR